MCSFLNGIFRKYFPSQIFGWKYFLNLLCVSLFYSFIILVCYMLRWQLFMNMEHWYITCTSKKVKEYHFIFLPPMSCHLQPTAASGHYMLLSSHANTSNLFFKISINYKNSYGYRNSHYKYETVWRPSQIYNCNPYTNKTVSSGWIGVRSFTCLKDLRQIMSSNGVFLRFKIKE